jgi:hypothetical protein
MNRYAIITTSFSEDSRAFKVANYVLRHEAIKVRRERHIESPDNRVYPLLAWNPPKRPREKFNLKAFLP